MIRAPKPTMMRNLHSPMRFARHYSTASVADATALKAVQERLLYNREDLFRTSWSSLLTHLSSQVEQVKCQGSAMIPDIDIKELKKDSEGNVRFSESHKARICRTGVAIIRNVLPQNIARELKLDLEEYIRDNKARPSQPSIFNLFWSKSQLRARSCQNTVDVQKALNNLWRTNSTEDFRISLKHPISYADRLISRQPRKQLQRLPTHLDGGIERWQDLPYGITYNRIFDGDWTKFDPFDYEFHLAGEEEHSKRDTVFKTFQGILFLSSQDVEDEVIKLNPMLKETIAYSMLRPFFAPITAITENGNSYDPENNNLDVPWELVGPTSCFPNTNTDQQLTVNTHPHLCLHNTMVPIPTIYPGDYVVWHCDSAFEMGCNSSSLNDVSALYIPSVPLSDGSLNYLLESKTSFESKAPPPDFSGTTEADFAGVGEGKDILTTDGKRALGLGRKPFPVNLAASNGERTLLQDANKAIWKTHLVSVVPGIH